MSIYHVRISVAGQNTDETKLDLTEDELRRQFLDPYSEGRPITVNGRVVELENMERIRISKSENSAKEIIPKLKADDAASDVALIGGPSYAWRAASKADDVTDQYITGPPGYLPEQESSSNRADLRLRRVTVPAGPGKGRDVFLVRGRNDILADAMTAFLRALDLRVIEWEQALRLTGEPNPYIGDIIAAGLEAADAVLVMATPDDFVRLDPALTKDSSDTELALAKQPRQNVIYEAGMAMALAPTRTLIVATPGTKILSDIAGRHLAYLDNSAIARKRLVGRLQNIGLAVDDSGDGWLISGDFDGRD